MGDSLEGGFEWSQEALRQDDGLLSLSVSKGELRVLDVTALCWKSWLNVFMYVLLGEAHAEGHVRAEDQCRVDMWHRIDEAWMELQRCGGYG